jgi:ornithine decarboxylase
LFDCAGAEWPLSRKFGCDTAMCVDVLVLAQSLGLDAAGVSFHVGSQQPHVDSWDGALASAADVFNRCADKGVTLSLINLGGGFPTKYLTHVPVRSDN